MLIATEALAVGYGERPVLRNLNFSLRAGGFVGLVGQNGSGKTTLFRTLLGILPPLAGRIQAGGEPGRPLVLGYVPQSEAFNPLFLLSAFEVALMGVCGRVKPARWVSRREKAFVHECLGQVGAEAWAHQAFSELSGGQRQRVLLARALVTRPDLLLLDEPTAGLDIAAASAVMELLRHLHRERHLTLFMVNHDLHVLRNYVEEVVWLQDGQATHGPVATMLSHENIEQMLQWSWTARAPTPTP